MTDPAHGEGPLREDEVLVLLRTAVVRVLEVEPDSVTAATRLVEDLRADSLALVEIVELVEEALAERCPGVHVDDEVLDGLRTVGDAVAAVLAALAPPAGSAPAGSAPAGTSP